jgi:hypothetical protein
MLEYFTELVFYEWAKKTNFGTNKSETNDAHKHVAETETAMEEMKDQEEAESSNTGDLNTDAKGRGRGNGGGRKNEGEVNDGRGMEG